MPTCSKTMSGGSPSSSSTRLAEPPRLLEAGALLLGGLAAAAHHPRELGAVDVADGAELLDQLALLLARDDADGVGAGQRAQLGREHAEAAGGAPDQHAVAGLQVAAVDQHPVGGEVREPVGGRLLPGEVLRLGQQLLGLDLAELGERAPGRLVAPDPLRRAPRAGRGRAPRDPRRRPGCSGSRPRRRASSGSRPSPTFQTTPDASEPPMWWPPVRVVAVAEHRDRLAERRPHVVEVDAGRHHAHDHLERAGLGDLDLLELEGVGRLALALLADHPGRHRRGQLARLGLDVCDLAQVNGHAVAPS